MRGVAFWLLFSLLTVGFWVPLGAQAFFIPVTSETVDRGTSDGFQNQQAADGLMNVKMEVGTPATSIVTLLPNANEAGGWSQLPCQTDPLFFDELDEDPADEDVTCRKEILTTIGVTVMSTLMQDITPPGLVDDYDVTATGRVRLEAGDDTGPTVTLASTPGPCGGLMGATTSSAYVDITMFFEECSVGTEWTEAQIDGLRIESRCPGDVGIDEECRATQHKAVVDIAYRTDFSVDFTSHFSTVFGVALAVQWDCTTTDDEGLDLWIDGALSATEVCSGTPVGSAPFADIPSPRAVDVRLVSRSQAGDPTESTYTFDVLRIEGNLNGIPVADAGPDQSVGKGSVVQLDATASSDPNGHTLSFFWTQTGGPTVGLIGVSTPTPTFTPALPGTYSILVTVTDGFGGADGDVVVVTVTNGVPTANAGTDQASARNVLVTLNGSGSSDPEIDTMSFDWSQVSGPAVILSEANTSISTFTPLLAGTYTFRLEVDDGFGGLAEDFVVVIVTNGVPSANAGTDQAVARNVLVTLDGSGSSDPDLDGLSFLWTQEAGIPVVLAGANTSAATFTPALPGTYVFGLLVSDSSGGMNEDQTVVTALNGNPVANAGPDQVVPTGLLVTLDGRGSSDPETDTLSFLWTQVSGPVVVVSGAATSVATFTPITVGTYTFSLWVDDGFGGFGEDFIVVSTTGANGVPTADAGFDQVVVKKNLVTLDGRNSIDPDFDVLTFQWAQLSGPLVVLAGATTAMPTFTPSASGTYTISMWVDDGFGGRAVDFVVVTVLDQLPVASAGPDRSGPKGTAITLDGTGSSDPDTDALSYLWTQTSGPFVTLSNPTAAAPSFTPSLVGTYAFVLIVDDGDGGSSADSVVAVVWGRAPVAVLTALPPSARFGVSILFGAVGSSDPDGTIAEYAFDFGDGGAVRGASTSAAHAYASAGTMIATLTVTDNDGNTSTDQVSVTITGNAAPVADVQVWTSSNGFIGTRFGFAGGNSTDDIAVTRFTWDFGDGTAGTGAELFHAFTARGTFTVRLTVEDAGGLTNTTTVAVIVANQDPTIASASPSSGTPATDVNRAVTFAIAAADLDGDLLLYVWRVDGVVVLGADASVYEFVSASAGAFIVSVTASDGTGQATRQWTVDVDSPSPTVQPGSIEAYLPEIVLLVIVVALTAMLLRSRGKGAGAPLTEGKGRAEMREERGKGESEIEGEAEPDDADLQADLDELDQLATAKDDEKDDDMDDLDL